jgi:hypothetical protein
VGEIWLGDGWRNSLDNKSMLATVSMLLVRLRVARELEETRRLTRRLTKRLVELADLTEPLQHLTKPLQDLTEPLK